MIPNNELLFRLLEFRSDCLDVEHDPVAIFSQTFDNVREPLNSVYDVLERGGFW
jgi:hypothetical protein